MSAPLRIAYLGPAPRPSGSVAGVAGQVLVGLADLGHSVDAYIARLDQPLPASLERATGFTLVNGQSSFRYDAWYSRTDFSKVVSGYSMRALAERQLAHELRRRHSVVPYDVVYQFSHLELFDLPKNKLPPIVVHPETHAAGELTWRRREHAIGKRCEPFRRRIPSRLLLSARAGLQKRQARIPAGFICPSVAFQRSFCTDYGVDPHRTRVVPNPIDLDLFYPRPASVDSGRPVKIVFVSRISVRKGVECVVELSHRIADLAGAVKLEVIGDRSLWSDYRRLLADLEPGVAFYRGGIDADSMPDVMRHADVLIQPSKYEPFGLTVGEALASGIPIIATTEVGAAEGVASECARVVPVEDAGALEREVRTLVREIQQGAGPRLAKIARKEAERLFRPGNVAASVASALEEFCR